MIAPQEQGLRYKIWIQSKENLSWNQSIKEGKHSANKLLYNTSIHKMVSGMTAKDLL